MDLTCTRVNGGMNEWMHYEPTIKMELKDIGVYVCLCVGWCVRIKTEGKDQPLGNWIEHNNVGNDSGKKRMRYNLTLYSCSVRSPHTHTYN